MYGDGKIVIEKITIYDTKVFLVEMRLDLKKNFGLLSLEQPCLKPVKPFFYLCQYNFIYSFGKS